MTRLTKLALSSALLCGLAACAAAVEEDAMSKTTAPVKAVKTTAPVVTVKPGASVSMTSVLPKSMTPGAFQSVQLRFEEAYADGIMTVRVEPSDGLSLFGGTGSKTFNLSVPGTHIWDVDVKADVDGVYFLNVFAEAQGQARAFSVRLNMGATTQKMFDDAMPADGELTDGGKIRVMDAEETIE